MTLEDQITALLAEAEPLRCLPDEEAEAKGLPALVDRINALRAKQAGALHEALDAVESAIEADESAVRRLQFNVQARADAQAFEAERQAAKARRGRPPKAKQEGADA